MCIRKSDLGEKNIKHARYVTKNDDLLVVHLHAQMEDYLINTQGKIQPLMVTSMHYTN